MGWMDRIKGWLGGADAPGTAAGAPAPGLPVVIKDRRGRVLVESRDHSLKTLVEHGCADNRFPLAEAALGGAALDALEGRSGDWRGALWPQVRLRRAFLTDVRGAMGDFTGADMAQSKMDHSLFGGTALPLPGEVQPASKDLSRLITAVDAETQIAHWKRHNRPVVAISGDFDVCDRRTLGFLRQARALGAQLVVVVNEGEGLSPAATRAAALLGQPEVSFVVASADPVATIAALKPSLQVVLSSRAPLADGVPSTMVERTGAILDGADLSRVTGHDSDMRGVSLIGARASRSGWQNAKFDGATLSLSTARQMDLRGATGLGSVTLVDDAGKRMGDWELTESGPRRRVQPGFRPFGRPAAPRPPAR